MLEWLETVGKETFDVNHHWLHYEFTPGRGQIHAHMLAIARDQSICQLAHEAKKSDGRNGSTTRAQLLQEWASAKFGLTAKVEEGFDEIDINSENSPTRIRFLDIENDPTAVKKDEQRLMKAVQCHQCNGFCMRNNKHKKK